MELKELATRSATDTASAILDSALELFCNLGYHSTTMAAIGRGANIEGPSIYHHFPSKQAMLHAITSKTFDDLQTIFDKSMAATEGESPSVRMAQAVRGYVLFHTHHRREAFVGASEIRSLEPEFPGGAAGSTPELRTGLRRPDLERSEGRRIRGRLCSC